MDFLNVAEYQKFSYCQKENILVLCKAKILIGNIKSIWNWIIVLKTFSKIPKFIQIFQLIRKGKPLPRNKLFIYDFFFN